MANVRKSSILGDMSGKIGTIVLTRWKNLNVVRSTPRTRKKRKKISEAEASQKQLFGLVHDFLVSIGGNAIRMGYQLSKKSKVTEINAATSYHMLHAVAGQYPDYSIDFAKVKLSMPSRLTENGWNVKFVPGKEGGLVVNWELNLFADKNTRLNDNAVVVFYDKNGGVFTVKNSATRNLQLCALRPLISRKGHEFYCWIFFVSADGKRVSETEYLGMLKMPEQQG